MDRAKEGFTRKSVTAVEQALPRKSGMGCDPESLSADQPGRSLDEGSGRDQT